MADSAASYDAAFQGWVCEIKARALRQADAQNAHLLIRHGYEAANLCATLSVARAVTVRDGCAREQAEEFVRNLDKFGELIDRMGGPKHPAMAQLAAAYDYLLDFANALIDLMIAGSF